MTPRLAVVSASEPERADDVGDDRSSEEQAVTSGKAGASSDDLRAENELLHGVNAELVRELAAQRRRIAKLLRLVEGQDDRKRATYLDSAREVYDYWREQCHPDAHDLKAGSKRERAIINRLADGYSIAYCKRAIDGAKHAPNRSEHGEPYDEFELIFREDIKIDSFHRRAPRAEGGVERWLGPRFDPEQ